MASVKLSNKLQTKRNRMPTKPPSIRFDQFIGSSYVVALRVTRALLLFRFSVVSALCALLFACIFFLLFLLFALPSTSVTFFVHSCQFTWTKQKQNKYIVSSPRQSLKSENKAERKTKKNPKFWKHFYQQYTFFCKQSCRTTRANALPVIFQQVSLENLIPFYFLFSINYFA